MAGRGPTPKDPSTLARRNKGPEIRVVEAVAAEQPKLPELVFTDKDGDAEPFFWPQQTRDWWSHWADHPNADEFTALEWDYLLATAIVHAKFFQTGDTKLLPELRLREQNFGVTLEARQRLRIQYATADGIETTTRRSKAEERAPEPPKSLEEGKDPRSILAAVK